MESTELAYQIPKRIVSEYEFPLIRNLARKLGKDVSIYDLESTTFVGEKTFGITEVAIGNIPFDGGPITMTSDLVNPENPISAEASEITGITQEMVEVKPTFEAWLDTFEHMALNTLAFGYNSTSFDGPGVELQSRRYGRTIKFSHTIDLRQRYIDIVRLSGNGRKGRLKDVLDMFGIVIPDGFHRAEFDVIATMHITEAMLEHYGITGLLVVPIHAMPLPTENVNKVKPVLDKMMQQVLDDIHENGYDKMRIARDRGVAVNKVSEIAWDLFYGGNLHIHEIEEPKVQEWMQPLMKDITDKAWINEETNKRLKPVYEAVKRIPGAPYIDYTQLKVALTQTGLR